MNNQSNTNYSWQREQLVAPINSYLQQNTNKPSLLLDGTGPRLTMHLPYLSGLGMNTLKSFEHVHAFSGGIGAYCAFLGQSLGALRQDLEYYYDGADRHARHTHRQPLLQYSKLLAQFIRKRPIYNQLHYMEFFRALLNEKFLQSPIDSVAPNFIPYIAHPDHFGPIALTAKNDFDRSKLTIYEVMAMSMKIPAFYSTPEDGLLGSAYDATYTSGYWSARNKLAASFGSGVVLSLYPRGLAKHLCVIDLAKNKKVKPYILYDMLALVLNIPNKRYKNDLHLAYL